MNAPRRRYGPDESTKPEPMRVTVIDFDMSFGHLVGFFIKAALAAIPAALVLALLGALGAALLLGLFGHSWPFR